MVSTKKNIDISTQYCIEIKSLHKRYMGADKDSLCGVNLRIARGDKYGILGPNGAGKTTLISILCGIFDQSAGQVTYKMSGEPVDFQMMRKTIGFVPQEYSFYPELSPYQNLEYFGAMYKLSPRVIKERANQILDVLGLYDAKKRRVESFSGGMKRRVNLAIGIIHSPAILFLDEPTVDVDVQSKMANIRFLNELNRKGTTIIYTSHHLDEAQEFCNTIALIDRGKIILKGPTQKLLYENETNDLKDLFIRYTGEAYRD